MLNSGELIASASEQAGLADYGSPTFRLGLERLIDAVDREAKLNEIGKAVVLGTIHRFLVNRLRVEDWWRQHPELANQQVRRPVIIVGMPRSGTTALSHLLAKDPSFRSLRAWEAGACVPPPRPESYETDPRYLEAIATDGLLDQINPGFKAIHYDPPDAPIECNQLLAHEFASSLFPTMLHIPSYLRWTLDADMTNAYAYHERMLKLLQSQMPGQWMLKGPQHGYALEALRRRYPDAILVVTHRDPTICAGSTASLAVALSSTFSAARRAPEIGELWASFIERCAAGLVAYAEAHGDESLVHVPYRDFIADPMAAVRRLYATIGKPLSADAESAMRRHLAEAKQHRYGVHRYELKDFGLDRAKLDGRYAAYCRQFSVEREVR